jgi:phage recombination protein Bet
MSNELTELKTNIAMWDDSQKLNEIRKIFAPKLNEMEFQYFVGVGKATGLNPFLREIWCVKYQDNAPAQVFIGRDGYRKAAQAHVDYDYHQPDAIYENDMFSISDGEIKHSYKFTNRGALVGAYCVVKRHKSSRPIYVLVELKEYSTNKSLWNAQTGKQATMIKKVAESQCLRAAFQDILGGTYSKEEEWAHETKEFDINTGEVKSQTEKLKEVLKKNERIIESELLEDKPPVHNTGRDDVAISDDQIDEISSLLQEKGFSEERITKALGYYQVTELEQLTDAQARLFILQLGKVK